MANHEHDIEILPSGVANAGLIRRVGALVHRPAGDHTPAVHALLKHLRAVGFGNAPAPIDIKDGEERITYIQGEAAHHPYQSWCTSDATLAEVARLMRRYHDASQSFVPPKEARWSDSFADPYVGEGRAGITSTDIGSGLEISTDIGSGLEVSTDIGSGLEISTDIGSGLEVSTDIGSGLEVSTDIGSGLEISTDIGSGRASASDRARGFDIVICHNDILPENVVFADGRAVGLLDFDFAAPGRRLWDIARSVVIWIPLDDPIAARQYDLGDLNPFTRLRLFCDSYGLAREARLELLDVIEECSQKSEAFVRAQVEAGKPAFVAIWEEFHIGDIYRRRRIWLSENRDRMQASLTD